MKELVLELRQDWRLVIAVPFPPFPPLQPTPEALTGLQEVVPYDVVLGQTGGGAQDRVLFLQSA